MSLAENGRRWTSSKSRGERWTASVPVPSTARPVGVTQNQSRWGTAGIVSFWINYAFALATVAIVLAGLAIAGRLLKFGGSLSRAHGTHVAIVDSVTISPRASLHVVKAGRRHLLIGATDARVCTLAEIDVATE